MSRLEQICDFLDRPEIAPETEYEGFLLMQSIKWCDEMMIDAMLLVFRRIDEVYGNVRSFVGQLEEIYGHDGMRDLLLSHIYGLKSEKEMAEMRDDIYHQVQETINQKIEESK